MTDQDKTALLSKLRAEGVQAGEHLTHQQIFDRFDFLEGLVNEWAYRKIGEAAIRIYDEGRAALASAPVAGEAVAGYMVGTDYFQPGCLPAAEKYGKTRNLPVRTLRFSDAAPQASEAVRLDAPAQVGGVRFGKGIHWSTVISAAQRHHAFMNTPEKEAERIARAKEFVESIQADKDGECKPCNGMGFIDGVGDRCPACNGDGGDRAKGAGDE